ncbi:MAG TPA: Trk system potassium transporter TrkA [Bacteroidales bacterium]|nr:MAG: Trk system potassium transport protein TrkA [Bacteroidetes bacterium GWE2_42_24]OFY25503.1 MAG: Trk system potassium transport protein TrkA [Bacteroidetes bacterium GWF2_43_11]HBZ66172.1 Trk system potassium transporter TrkA [Bacteroidales bacterium]
MNIIIAGDGEVGFHLAKIISAEHHNITIVDPHSELLRLLESESDIMTLAGDSTSIAILEEAKIHKTDLLISVVHDDAINIVTCILGKRLGAKRTIARVNNTEYLTEANKSIMRSLGIDAMVCPERIASKEVLRMLTQSGATEVFDFSDGKLSLFLLKLDEECKVLGKSLDSIARENPKLNFRAVAIHRDRQTIIPKGQDKFLFGDLAYVITRPGGINELLNMAGRQRVDIKSVMIIGGGRIGLKTAMRLEKSMRVKLVDADRERCLTLSDQLSNTLIINADARDFETLEAEGLGKMDAFIAVTDNNETNMFTCLMAKKAGVKKVIPLIENIDFIDMAQNIGLEAMINKKLITASYIARFTMDAEVTSIKCLNGIDAEVLEFVVKKDSLVTRMPIRELPIIKDAIIGGVVRGEESYIALGNFQIVEGDKVVVFALPPAITKIEKFFN